MLVVVGVGETGKGGRGGRGGGGSGRKKGGGGARGQERKVCKVCLQTAEFAPSSVNAASCRLGVLHEKQNAWPPGFTSDSSNTPLGRPVSNTEPNTRVGPCHPISASEDQRQDLEALQGSAACATGTHQLFPVTWHGGAASAESMCNCRHAQNVSL